MGFTNSTLQDWEELELRTCLLLRRSTKWHLSMGVSL